MDRIQRTVENEDETKRWAETIVGYRFTTMAVRCQRANQAGWGVKTNAKKRPTRCQAAVHDARHVLEPFLRRNAVKIIVGLRNYDVQVTHDVALAAWRGGASMVDVACDEDVVAAAREATKDQLPICASAVDPHAFDVAVKAGASMLEVGNYDGFYPDGIVFSAEDVLQITRDTMKRHPNMPMSVTVPHTLPLDEQVALALKLEQMGVDVIQTEGGVIAEPFAPGLIGLVQKAAPSIAATHAIARALEKAHVMCASGLSSATAPMAISAGASGVGVGSAINKLNDPVAMVATVQAIVDAVHGEDLPSHLREEARSSYAKLSAREERL
uniref:Uncharacterized protein ycf23 n=1 Tax=Picocystis salinarum TaxID=88271 RepID=A0A7S3UI83_9CHLO|mmetsp:Transcript_9568/g.58270  ORF Transcript_9568/g.58270 Transcript_9568/m.58270 type:complete len:327 (+) Transcript_9568:103-1083(+)